MDKLITEIQGFDTLREKIKRLPDKVKRREVLKILRRSARSTVKVARMEAPKSDKPHNSRGKKIQPGNLRKSIRAASMRRSRVPMVVVGPRSSGKYDGWYGRQFVIPGHNIYRAGFKRNRKGNQAANAAGAVSRVPANPFMDRAQAITKGKVTADAVAGTEKYIQRQIDRL